MKRSNNLIIFGSIILIVVISAIIFLSPLSTTINGAEVTEPKITNMEVYQVPDMSKPNARVPYTDPVFGTYVVRVTDSKTDIASDDGSKGLTNEYSRVQAFNANGKYLMVRGIEGTWYVYDALTLKPVQENIPVEADPRWDANDPNKIYFFSFELPRLMVYNLETKKVGLVHDFSKDFSKQQLSAVWTRYEGSPSKDGRYWGLMAQDPDWETVAYLVYDQLEDKIIARKEVDKPSIDSVTISPLGNYFLAFDDERGMVIYDRNLENEIAVVPNVGHCDIALDAQNREVLVYQDTGTDNIAIADLATGKVTNLWPIDFSHGSLGFHFSGRAFKMPGWALVSCYIEGIGSCNTWMDNTVFAMELKTHGRVVRLAHHHSAYNPNMEHDYWAEPHATANQDFTRILFTSNWGKSGTEEVEMYMIKIPSNWPNNL